jgi:hypothetical protein
MDIPTLYKKYEDLFDFAIDAVEKSLEIVIGQNLDTLEKAVTLFHYIRASYLLEAINKLCVEGLATEAMVILRSLLNLYINIKWLTSGDSKKRFEKFADFEVVFKKSVIDKILEFGDIQDEIKDDDPAIHDDAFKKVKEKYNLKKGRDFYKWSGKSIFQMAKDVNLEKEYQIIYGRLSSTEHTGPESVREYLDDSDIGKIIVRKGPRDENIDMVLLTSLDYYFNVKVIMHKIFYLDWSDKTKLEQEVTALKKKYWGEPPTKM